MDGSNRVVPKPHRRMTSTWLKRPRDLSSVAPPLKFAKPAIEKSECRLAAEWGQLVLLSDMVFALHRDGTVSQRCHVAALLWGERDLADWDEVTREFDARHSLETIRKACVHLPDGSTMFARRTYSNPERYSRLVRLNFSPLRPGAVVELESQFDRFRPFDVAPGLWAQLLLLGTAPRRRSRLTVVVAEPFAAGVRLHHCEWQPIESREGGYHVYCWDLFDMPGVELDASTPPPLDFLPWVEVTTLPSWRAVADHYRRELDPGDSASVSIRELAARLTVGGRTPLEKAQSIYRYATQDVRYGRHPRDIGRANSRRPTDMLADLRGDCRDKSALIVSLLRQLGIPAEIALLRTRPNGKAPQLPAPCFDHAIVRTHVSGQNIWLDAVGGPCTFGSLPAHDQGATALVLHEKAPALLVLPEATQAEQCSERIVRGHLASDGEYRCHVEVQLRGDRALGLRRRYLCGSSESFAQRLGESLAASHPAAVVSSATFTRLEDLSEDVAFEFTARFPNWGRCVGNLLLMRCPWIEPFPAIAPLGATMRKQPMLAPAVLAVVETHAIEVPFECIGRELPPAFDEKCDWGTYQSTITLDGTQLICRREFHHLGGIVPTASFRDFKRYCDRCRQADRADIVLMTTSQAIGEAAA